MVEEPEQTGSRVTRLAVRGDRPDLDVPEAQQCERTDAGGVLVEPGRQPDPIGEGQAQHLGGIAGAGAEQGAECGAHTGDPVERPQAAEADPMSALGVHRHEHGAQYQSVHASILTAGDRARRASRPGAHRDARTTDYDQ